MPNSAKPVSLYIAEEQQILREAYHSFFAPHPDIEVVGASDDTADDSLTRSMATLKPKVLLLGIKILQPGAVERLEALRKTNLDTTIVMLSAYYDVKGITALRHLSSGGSAGCTYLLKHTLDTVEQLTQIVLSVADGRIILD